jgi:hypothetical protein
MATPTGGQLVLAISLTAAITYASSPAISILISKLKNKLLIGDRKKTDLGMSNEEVHVHRTVYQLAMTEGAHCKIRAVSCCWAPVNRMDSKL